METKRKHQIALLIYRQQIKEKGIRCFPKQAGKEVEKIAKLLNNEVSTQDICIFLGTEHSCAIQETYAICSKPPCYSGYGDNFPAGKIALVLLMGMTEEAGVIRLNADDFKKKIGNAHKLTGVPKAEMLEFFTDIISNFLKSIKV